MVLVAKRKKTPSGFGANLRARREEKGFTKAQLAEAAGVPPIYVGRYERGEVEPTWPIVLKLAAALGVEPNDFK